ncbi:MAG: hypothetical protein JWP14_1563 [Frankiales bacterium]|nr:hypothetical protein [Frankiales bacterium]
MKQLGNWLLRQWVNHPLLDVGAGLVCLVGLILLSDQVTLIRELVPDTRRAIYQTAATLSGTLLGLVLTSISILNTLLRADLEALTGGRMRPRTQRRAGTLFFSATRALAVALLAFLTLVIVDTKPAAGKTASGSVVAQAVALSAVLVLASRLGRVGWVLSRLLDASAGLMKPVTKVVPIEDSEAPG